MRINTLSITLGELQEALSDYAYKHAKSQPEIVIVESYDKVVISVGLRPGDCVEASEFKHRTEGGL